MEHRLDAKIDGLALELRETLALIRADLAVGRDHRQQRRPRDRALPPTPTPFAPNTNQHRQPHHDYYSDSGDERHGQRPFVQADPGTDEDVEALIHGPNDFHNQPRYNRTPKSCDYRVKVDIPFFNGNLHFEDFLDWLTTVENFFEYMNVPEEKQVTLVAYKLRGGASAWWENLKLTRCRAGKRPIQSWAQMPQLLRSQFLPSNYEQLLYQQYQNCSQQNHSVREYTEEFHRLSARNNIQESEIHHVARYTGGLRRSIQEHVNLRDLWTLSEAINLAYRVELQQTQTPYRASTSSQPYQQTYSPPNQTYFPPPNSTYQPLTHPPNQIQPNSSSHTNHPHSDLHNSTPKTIGKQPTHLPNTNPNPNLNPNPYARPTVGKCYR